jgi:hypothetical protein
VKIEVCARLAMLLFLGTVVHFSAACASGTRPVRILFIGNSYTYYNNMPAIAEAIYEASGAGHMETGMLVQAGQSLSDAAGPRLPELLRLMMGGRWDYVVLQQQSTLGGGFRNGRPVIGDPAAFHDAVRTLDREIREAGGRTVLLVTWANAAAPEQQAAITDAYDSIGAEIGAIIVRAGPAWDVVRRQHPGIRLHQADGSHPNENGSYLTACVLLEELFRLDLSTAPGRIAVTDLLSPGRRETTSITIDPEVATTLRGVAMDAPEIGK